MNEFHSACSYLFRKCSFSGVQFQHKKKPWTTNWTKPFLKLFFAFNLNNNTINMSYRSGFGGGPPSKNSAGNTSKTYSMNAVPPPSSLGNSRYGKFQKSGNLSTSGQANTAAAPQTSSTLSSSSSKSGSVATVFGGGLSKHGYSTMSSIAQFASSSQYALGKRKSKTEDEYDKQSQTNSILLCIHLQF